MQNKCWKAPNRRDISLSIGLQIMHGMGLNPGLEGFLTREENFDIEIVDEGPSRGGHVGHLHPALESLSDFWFSPHQHAQEAADDDSNTWVPAIHVGDRIEFLAPGFYLAQSQSI